MAFASDSAIVVSADCLLGGSFIGADRSSTRLTLAAALRLPNNGALASRRRHRRCFFFVGAFAGCDWARCRLEARRLDEHAAPVAARSAATVAC